MIINLGANENRRSLRDYFDIHYGCGLLRPLRPQKLRRICYYYALLFADVSTGALPCRIDPNLPLQALGCHRLSSVDCLEARNFASKTYQIVMNPYVLRLK